MQARTPRIMRFPQPHDPDGRPCLPTHHPRSQPPSPNSPRPTPPAPGRRSPAPAGLPGRRPRPAKCSWPPPPAGRHPGHGRRRGAGRGAVDRRDRRVGRRRASAGPGRAGRPPPRPRPLHASRPRPPSAGPLPAWTPTPWPVRSAPGWPTGSVPVPRPAGGGPWPSTARRLRGARAGQVATAARCTCWRRWTTPAARCWPNARSAAPPRRSPRSTRCWRPGPGRRGGHRRRAADPPRGRRVPGRRASGPTTCLWSRPTSRPCWTAARRLPWHRVPELDRTRDRGHGRIELRTLKAVTVHHFGFPHAAQVLQVTRKTRNCDTSRWRDRDRLRDHQPHRSSRPAPPAWPTCCAATGRSRRCTTSATSPSPRTAPRSAPAPPPTSWRPCATWSSGCSVGRGRSTSPPRCAATPATHADPSPPSGSASDEPDITTERRSPDRIPTLCRSVCDRCCPLRSGGS